MRLAAVETPPDTSDTSDAPETVDSAHAERGRFAGQRQLAVTLWLDAEVVDHFARGGAGYEARLNAALREWVATRQIG